jgi:NADPH:quinone reductase-like Zn-dependent oxidoreductase
MEMSNHNTMKAAVYQRYGSPDVLRITEIPKPVPKDGEILIKTHAASVNAYDWHLLRAAPFFTRFSSGLFKPRNKILGADIAGVAETAGEQFKPGDEVYGCLESCGAGGLAAGGFAEYVCAKESVLVHKPQTVTFEEAAALPMAAVTALQGLRDSGHIKVGQEVLINGASGGVGTFAVQIAKAFGAEVTGVCGSGSAETVYALGAGAVIDYSAEDFVQNGRQYDLILDIAANRTTADYHRALKPDGVCVMVGYSTARHMIQVVLAGLRPAKADGQRITLLMAKNTNQGDLLYINGLIEAGKLKPAIDSRYPLSAVADAIRRVETGHPKGKVVVKIAP